MKNFKQLAWLPMILFGLSASAQDWTTCDDFSDLLLYPNETFVAGELIGYSQGGTQEINCVTGFANVNEFPEGIMGVGTVDYEFDGTNQIARFYMYGNMFEFDNMGFSVNGSSAVMLDGTFPMTIAGVTVDLDLSPPNVAEWDYYYLTFTGPIDVVSQIYYETAVVELCVEQLEETDLSVVEETTNQLTAFPNPVEEVLTITSDEQLASVKIYTITGDLVLAQPVISDEIIQLSFAELQAGFYFVVGTSLNGDEFVSKIAKN